MKNDFFTDGFLAAAAVALILWMSIPNPRAPAAAIKWAGEVCNQNGGVTHLRQELRRTTAWCSNGAVFKK